MKEAIGNIWNMDAYYKCITTNGTVKSNGRAVMGRGIALQARDKFPELDKALGLSLKIHGNVVKFLFVAYLWSFPVKHNWWEQADLELIKRSAQTLGMVARDLEYDKTFLLPRPGCGNGGLKWEDVKPIIEPILPDNVTVVTL